MMRSHGVFPLLFICSLAACEQGPESTAQDTTPPPTAQPAPIEANPGAADRQALFGDLHVHSSWSLDGYIFGNDNDPRAAYRYARGEEVTIAGGASSRQLKVPLDFTAVTDHAETLGYFQRCMVDSQADYFDEEVCQMLRARDLRLYFKGFRNLSMNPPQHIGEICPSNQVCRDSALGPWQQLQAIADEFYQPGEFTTFKAYEYTGNLPKGGMLHRNVIFANDTVPAEAMSAFDLLSARELWEWLEAECVDDCDVITIPHNSNLAWGNTFATTNIDGSNWTLEDQQRRQRYDRLAEIFQAKGNSECQTGIGNNDEFCNFEVLLPPCESEDQLACSRDTSFVRNGLKLGLQLNQQLGFNPHQYGIIGSTDTHNGTPGDTSEVGYAGHQAGESTLEKRLTGGHRVKEGRGAVNYNPGGLAGAWARDNTRESLFAAFKRRETFGTSGNRVRIRLFAGWDYPEDLASQVDAIATAYREGVPMGETLPVRAGSAAPALFAWAAQDPDAQPLQRLQIVKGWTGADGEVQEYTYDVACSDGLAVDSQTHRCPDNGASVDLADCTATGSSGAPQLATVWRDPDFDPTQRAFYYARVLENPACRWSTYDLLESEGRIEPSSVVPKIIQERAWSSPVWLQPAGDNTL
jgi:uncharacterized protein DUF3604